MQHQRIRQEKHRAPSSEQELRAKSHSSDWPGRSGWNKVVPVMAWVVILAGSVIALQGGERVPPVQAAGRPDRESEAALGDKHGERRHSGCEIGRAHV